MHCTAGLGLRAPQHLPGEGRGGSGEPIHAHKHRGEGTEDRAVPSGPVLCPHTFIWGTPTGPQIHPRWGHREGADGKATVTPLRPIATAVPVSPGWAPGCHPTLPRYEHTPGALLSSQLFGMHLEVLHVPSGSEVVTRSSTPLYELRGDLFSLGEPAHGP